MSRRVETSRREFTVASALALLGGATITVGGCGGGSGNRTTAAQLSAGGAASLDLQTGSSGHRHTVDLTADDVMRIRTGNAVTRESTEADLHRHMVSFVAPATGPGTSY